jgi:HD-like signal output (HDOD) protein
MLETARKLLEAFKRPKTLPQVAMRISNLISDDNCTIEQLDEIIRMDPMLIFRLLRLINSPYYGLREKVNDISQALVFIGMQNLRNLVIMEAMKDIFQDHLPDALFSRKQLWFHCAGVAICGKMISERIFARNGENAFLCGILHDVGLIVENQVAQKALVQTLNAFSEGNKPLILYENHIMGTNHCLIGFCLAEQWRLPLEVQEGIRHHHSDLKNGAPDRIAGILQMAEYIVTLQGYPALPGMVPQLSPCLVEHIRHSRDEYRTLIRDLPDEIQKARDLYLLQEPEHDECE